MSNLDTTRRNFYKWHYENQNAVSADIADWWLTQFHQLMNEKREAIEGMKEVAHQSDGEFRRNRITIKNDTLDDVLSILKQ